MTMAGTRLFRRPFARCQVIALLMILQGTGRANEINGRWIEYFQRKMPSGFCPTSGSRAVANRGTDHKCISSLFDVVIDNSQRHGDIRAKNRPTSTATEQFRHIRRKRFSGNDISKEEIPNAYKFGTTLLAVTEDDVIFKFFFPRPLLSKYCNYNGHSKFLLNEQHICLQSVDRLSEICETDKGLSASFFFKNYRLLKSPSFLKGGESSGQLYADFGGNVLPGNPFWSSTTNDSVAVKLLSQVEDHNEKTKRSDFPGVGEPFWDASNRVCRNVALKADFVIRVDNNNSIDEAYVVVQTGDVSSSAGDFPRHFSIRYDRLAGTASSGYELSSPLRVLATHPDLDENATRREEWLTVPKPSPSGYCESGDRHTVRFGHNTFGSCFISLPTNLNATICQRIQRVINERLHAVPGHLLVSPYAQPTTNDKENWINVSMRQKPSTEESFENGHCRLVTDARMEIVYLRDYDRLNGTYVVVEATISFGKVRKLPPLVESTGFGAQPNSRRYIVQMAVTFFDRTPPEERNRNTVLPIVFNELYSLFFGALS